MKKFLFFIVFSISFLIAQDNYLCKIDKADCKHSVTVLASNLNDAKKDAVDFFSNSYNCKKIKVDDVNCSKSVEKEGEAKSVSKDNVAPNISAPIPKKELSMSERIKATPNAIVANAERAPKGYVNMKQVNMKNSSAIKNSALAGNAGITIRGKFRKVPSAKLMNRNMMGKPPFEIKNFNTESYAHQTENDFKEVKTSPLSTFSTDVDTASYSNVRRLLDDGNMPPKGAVRVEEFINYFTYDYNQPKAKEPFNINLKVGDCLWSENKIIQIGLQTKKPDISKLPPSNLVFLLDVSGSMGQPNKLPLLKKSLKLLTKQLRAKDKVSIVVYAGAAGLVLDRAKGNERRKIAEALDNLRSGGSTAGGAGIKLAYDIALKAFIKNGNNRIILATDGDFNVGQSSDSALVSMIEKKREKGIFLTVLGFGMGNYKDSKMEQLADKGNGNYAYIDTLLEAKKVLVTQMSGTLYTVAKDVKVQVEFNPTLVYSYRLVGYENRALANEDFNDDKKDAAEIGMGHRVTALYEIKLKTGNESSKVDNLKYQKNTTDTKADSNELATVKIRYKKPDGKTSSKMEKVIKIDSNEIKTDDFNFAQSVAGFAMILTDSKHKGKLKFSDIITNAKKSKGKDNQGYRAEFIKIVEKAELIK